MAKHNQTPAQADGWSAPEPFDDIQNLYVAEVAQLPAQIATNNAQKPLDVILSGEVQLYGHVQGSALVVERVRRVALHGTLAQPNRDLRLGVLSLVGPLEGIIEAGKGTTGMQLQLHYEALSTALPPRATAAGKFEDAVFSEVEVVPATLGLNAQDEFGGSGPALRVDLKSGSPVERKLGYVQAIDLAPTPLVFYPVGTGTVKPSTQRSLHSTFAPQVGGCLPNHDTVTRRMVPLRFVNLALQLDNPDFGDLEAFCQLQIDGIDEVWGKKAALEFAIQGQIAQGSLNQIQTYAVLPKLWELLLPTPNPGPSFDDPGQVEVYLIQQFDVADRHGGGISHRCGVASAYAILDIGFDPDNKYLLAHELGHILGLDHPRGVAGVGGSSDSVMEPVDPNSSINTLQNCLIFTQRQANTPLNPVVTIPASSTSACFVTERDS